ncbi:MAG: lamin tail domain-containing protein [Flavobacteriales bacterium]|nr:lamin tail domain-containing protein [Flavobacteriales bacterium]
MLSLFNRLYTCLFLLVSASATAQFSDDFSDGDFTNNPTWSGENAEFTVDAQRLRLTAPPQTDTSYLSVDCQAIDDATWEFFVQFDFNPSSSNFARVYLVSNNTNLRGSLNGYFVRIGGETEDRISLYKQSGTTTTQIIASTDGLVNSDPVTTRIRVTRSANSDWELLADVAGGTSFQSLGSVNDTTFTQSLYSGVWCKYTSTRSDKFYFDDFNVTGNVFIDSELPTVEALSVISNSAVDLLFNETVSPPTAENVSNYVADNGLGSPSTAIVDGNNPRLVHLTYVASFTNGTTYQLTTSNVQDLAGNTMLTDTRPFIYVVPSPSGFRDIVINEFMPDPSPVVGLADAEYVEVYNASDSYIDLTGWKLGDAASFGTVGAHIIAPGEFALLIATGSAPLFAFYPNVVTVTSFPSLNNAGDDIILQDANEETIDQLRYDLSWYQDEAKEDGGYSLEQINPFAACSNPGNWRASEHPLGGTPTSQNSLFDNTPDTMGPALTTVVVLGPQTIQLNLNEALNVGGISASNISIEPVLTVASANANAPSNNSISVNFTAPIDSGIVYTVTITGITDCEGNLQQLDSVRTFILPFDADSGDFVINEVLFDPFTGGSDYVELVNVTARPLNLKGWLLAAYDEDDGVSSLRVITQENYAVPAGGYVLIAEDTANVMMNYVQHGINNFIEADMPTYNNDSGTVYLLRNDSILMEYFSYSDDMHFPLLSIVDGVSLERLDVNRPVNDKGNWHSAAQTVGFGTPGLENSQYYPTSGAVGDVSMDPEIFSPYDEDGYNDVLNINYSFTEPGFVGTIRIYDANGRPVRSLITNELLETAGTFTWDGTTDKREKARIGIYIVLFEAFSVSGEAKTYKLSTVLGGRL